MTGEVMTGTGNTAGVGVEAKRTQVGANTPGAKGDTRNAKHESHNRSAYDTMAKEDGDSGEKVGEHDFRNRY